MKKLLTLSLLIILALACSAPASNHAATALSSEAPANVDPQTITVYITRTGEKYHRAGCQHLRRSSIPITLTDAIKRGYAPCKVCRPPR
jgi:hypothetical protein